MINDKKSFVPLCVQKFFFRLLPPAGGSPEGDGGRAEQFKKSNKMKYTRYATLIACTITAILFTACSKKDNTEGKISITGFTPEQAFVGDVVTITGTGFSNDSKVSFNDAFVITIVSASPNELKVKVPANATTGKIKITTADKSAISAGNFTVNNPDEDITGKFTDAVFKAYVISEFDPVAKGGNGDGKIQWKEINTVTHLNVSFKNIASLVGVEYFTALTGLACYYGSGELKSLDVSKNTALRTLSCDHNQLTSLDVSKNTALTDLNFASNKISTLDISKCTALTYVNGVVNELTALNVSNNTALTTLFCGSNKLTALDVSKNTALTKLGCDNNQLTTLNVSNNTALTGLYCDGNKLTGLNISNNEQLKYIDCRNNNISIIRVWWLATSPIPTGVTIYRDAGVRFIGGK
jgi:hypothetical protein